MALVPSSSSSNKLLRGVTLFFLIFALAASGLTPCLAQTPNADPSAVIPEAGRSELEAGQAAAPSDFYPKSFDSFSALRNALLDAVARATRRVWLTTDYLTDGEFVSALYIAQYRKLDVKVLLARARANGYLSRLNYLKNQNVPVFLRPETFRVGKPTALLCDDLLLYVDSELDYMAKRSSYMITSAPSIEPAPFIEQFTMALNQEIPAVAHPLPLVGKALHRAPSGRSGGSLPTIQNTYQPGTIGSDGSYTYSGGRAPKPTEIPDRLPKQTIQQKRDGMSDNNK